MFRALLCSKHVGELNKLIIKQEFVHYVAQVLRLRLRNPCFYAAGQQTAV